MTYMFTMVLETTLIKLIRIKESWLSSMLEGLGSRYSLFHFNFEYLQQNKLMMFAPY